MTGHAVLTPMLQAISMLAGDFVSMARTADRATPSSHPNVWRLRNLTVAAIPLALFKVLYCVGVLATGAFRIGLNAGQMQTLTLIRRPSARFCSSRTRLSLEFVPKQVDNVILGGWHRADVGLRHI